MPKTAYIDTRFDCIHDNALMKLTQMAKLKNNWDGYGAEPLSINTLSRAECLIRSLHIQPEIFPTATGSIQFEFEKNNGDYLEIQFTGKGTCEVFRCIGGYEEYFNSQDNPCSINAIVDNFYGRNFCNPQEHTTYKSYNF